MMDALGSKKEYSRRHHGKTINFIAPGVEKQQPRDGRKSLVYGTATASSCLPPERGRRHSHTIPEQRSWENLRMVKQQRDAEEDLDTHQDAKQQARVHVAEEKRKDLELLQQYDPWGKPAPGAPRWTPSGSLLARGDAPISRQGERKPEKEVGSFPPLGRPGGGAPLRSHDGHVDASMRAHPETRFQKHLRREVENSLRYKGMMEGRGGQTQLRRSVSEEERDLQRYSQQSRYARRLEGQIEEAEERKKREAMVSPPSYFPFGQSIPRRDESGKLVARQRPRPRPPQNEFESIVEHIERVGRRRQQVPLAHCTHPFTHGSRCKLSVATTPERIAKQSLPTTVLQREAVERQRERQREREEGKVKRNSHHALWEGGCQYNIPTTSQT